MADPIVNRAAKRYIPVAKPSTTAQEAMAVYNAVSNGQLAGGPRVELFEREFSERVGKRHGIACNSGTTALHLALVAAGVGVGDQVILPTLTYVGVANAVLYCGATPIFVDSRTDDGNPDERWLEDCRIAGCRTKAVIVPHLYGVPAKSFLKGCREHVPNAVLIEDCAEAHFATIETAPAVEKPVGSFGRYSCWSFFGNKIISTGQGGMVCCNDERAAERLRSLRGHCTIEGSRYSHDGLGFNYHMTEMQGAVGLAQLNRAAKMLARRKELAERYIEQLGGLSWLHFPARTPGSVWWVFAVLCANPTIRQKLRAKLADSGIETRPFFEPLHKQTHLLRYASHQYPVAEVLGARGMHLPLFADMTDADVDYVCRAMREL